MTLWFSATAAVRWWYPRLVGGGHEMRTRSNGVRLDSDAFTDRLVRKFRLPVQRVARTSSASRDPYESLEPSAPRPPNRTAVHRADGEDRQG